MMFGETPLLEALRISILIANLACLYLAIRLVLCAHKVYKQTSKDKTAKLLLLTFSAFLAQSLFSSVTYTLSIFRIIDTHLLTNIKNLVSQLLLFLSMLGFWYLHIGE